MIEVLLADDQKLIRDGMISIIEKNSHISIVDVAENGDQAIELLNNRSYDVVLLDISMPGKNGIDTLEHIKDHFPKQQVLILSVFPEDVYAIRVLKLGANGYLTKNCDASELKEAIIKIAEGGRYITQELAELLAFTHEIGSEKPKHQYLSNREFDIFCKIAEGKTIKKIAIELKISDRTVSTYRYRIMDKLCMTNNAEITRYALEHHLIL